MTEITNIISLGAGVQSSTMALMAAHGDITPMPKAAIFADTQSEPQSVYKWLDWLEKQLPFPVIRVTHGNLLNEAVRVITTKHGTKRMGGWPPIFAIGDSGVPSPMMRQCTTEFKINPIRKALREFKPIIQWIGISFDEVHRMKPSRDNWITNRWPLIDLRMKRYDCLNWMNGKGYPEPPRSACIFCPYMRDREWLRLKNEEPESFKKAIWFEKEINIAKEQIGFIGDLRLHRSMKLINEVEFNPHRNQINLFGNECEGMCGV